MFFRLVVICYLLVYGSVSLAADMTCETQASGQRVMTYHGDVQSQDAYSFAQPEKRAQTFQPIFKRCFEGGYRGQIILDLHSRGGSVVAGLEISRFIASYPQPVAVRVSQGNYCISACTYIFLAGKFRDIAAGASLEPHGFSAYFGNRIDSAITELRYRLEKSKSPDFNIIKQSRLMFMASSLDGLAAQDSRFSWMKPFLDAVRGGMDDREMLRMMDIFAALQPEQKLLIAQLDSIIQLVITEVEREAALKAFKPYLDKLAGRSAGNELALITGQEEVYWQWMSDAYLAACNGYIKRINTGKPLGGLDVIKANTKQLIKERVVSTMSTVNAELWPYLSTRDGEIDLAGFIRLMFSTSILYTRPLTREELCDLNLVNRGCA